MKCQRPHIAGNPANAEAWGLIDGCERPARWIVLVMALHAEGGPYQERPPREPVEIAIGACGVCAASVAVSGVEIMEVERE